MKKRLPHFVLFALGTLLLSACESDNDHFCAKYSYYYRELTEPGVLPYRDLKALLEKELEESSRDPDRTKIALFVLEDIDNRIKPEHESAQDFCMRRERWKFYR